MKRLAVLGSTGSIGTSTLQVAKHLKDSVRVVALAAKSNVSLLEAQAKELRPEIVAIYDEKAYKALQSKLPFIRVVAGIEGLQEVATYPDVDLVVSAISGTAGLLPTVAAINAGHDVALANKETLVAAGHLVTALAAEKNVRLIPVDSEHSAIFQCLQGHRNPIRRLLITASGGPFRNHSLQQMQHITVQEALAHPTWTMGRKVTVDSSTLMNKGLEVIEAHWLFQVPVSQIEVLVHPQSIVHSMVEFVDGSLLAQMGTPSMITPIQYAITYPERMPGLLPPMDFAKNGTLQFYPPPEDKFPCLALAFEAIKKGGSLPCYMNAANETLVGRFLAKELPWIDIGKKLELLMERHHHVPVATLSQVLAVDALAREDALRC